MGFYQVNCAKAVGTQQVAARFGSYNLKGNTIYSKIINWLMFEGIYLYYVLVTRCEDIARGLQNFLSFVKSILLKVTPSK